MQHTRRDVLGIAAGAASAPLLGGCIDGSAGGAGGDAPAQASFFLLYDFAKRVAGDELAVESVVPFGQHGHGWEPTGQVQRDIYDAPLFAYVGEGFQPWADDVVANLRRDGADVEIVEAWDGVELLPFDGEAEHDEDHDADGHGGHDEHDDGGDHDQHDDGHDENDGDGDHDGDDGSGAHDGHGHGRHDPHFWLDPTRAVGAVENIRDGFQAVDPAGESGYRDRADRLASDLSALDETVHDRLGDASKDAVLVAGHNAFRYVGRRYGFDVHGLSGLSPDEEPSASARREAANVVAEHDVEYILAPALESKRAASQLVAETDATDYVEVAAMSGLKDTWQQDGWGYLEIMRNVNLPSLAQALGAE